MARGRAPQDAHPQGADRAPRAGGLGAGQWASGTAGDLTALPCSTESPALWQSGCIAIDPGAGAMDSPAPGLARAVSVTGLGPQRRVKPVQTRQVALKAQTGQSRPKGRR